MKFDTPKYEGRKKFKNLYFNKRYFVAVRNFAKKTTMSTVGTVALEVSISVLYNRIFKNGKRRREQPIIGVRAGRRKCLTRNPY